MKTSSTWNFRSIVGKIMMGLVLAAMVGSADVVPSFGEDDHDRGERHDNGRHEQRGRGHDRDRMSATAMSTAGGSIALMATGRNEFMSRRRSSMHRRRNRASNLFSAHRYSLRGIASRRLPSVHY